MKNIKILKALFLIGLFSLGASSCTKDFEEVNTNNNSPTVDKAAVDQLLTSSIENITERVHEIFLGHEMGSCWAQQMAKVQYTDEDRYIFRPDVVNNTWSSFYAVSGQDVSLIYKVAGQKELPNYQGVALVLKVYIVSVVTDLFGDVPYTDAFKGDVSDGGILDPKYDTQESIYRDLIAKLDDANTMLDAGGLEIAGDILFDNDITKWKKFANSLRLRLLLRMSAKDASFVTTEMSKMIADADTYPIFESSEDGAALVFLGSSPSDNPIYENRLTRDDHRVSKHFIDMLQDDYNDYRIMVYANPSEGTDEFVGIPNGLRSSDAAAYNGNGLKNTSKIGDYWGETATAPGMLMSYAELQFILAEAAVKGYIPGGDSKAKSYYQAGITGSFEQYRDALQAIFDDNAGDAFGGLSIPAGYTVDKEISKQLANTSAAAWDTSIALKLIGEQRYIATFDQGLQSWFEWRRTGIPALVVPEANSNGGKIPVRVPYPSNEATRNPDNLKAAIAEQGVDNLNTKVWWETGN